MLETSCLKLYQNEDNSQHFIGLEVDDKGVWSMMQQDVAPHSVKLFVTSKPDCKFFPETLSS